MAEAIATVGAVISIVKVIDIITKSITSLRHIQNQWKDADLACLSLAAQLTTLRAALTKIKEWMDDSLEAAHHQLIMDLDVSISCCNLLMLKIDSLLPTMTELTTKELGFSDKMKVLFESRNADEAQKLIERQTSALGLLLSACSCKTLAEQKTLLEKSKSRKKIDRIQLDSASLWVHRDTDTLKSRFSDNLSKLSLIFPFDSIVFSSNVYERVFRGSLKNSLRQQQIGLLNETERQQRDGQNTAASFPVLSKEEGLASIIGPGSQVGFDPPKSYLVPSKRHRPTLLWSRDDNETKWCLDMLSLYTGTPLHSKRAIDKTVIYCANVLISTMETLDVRPEKRSNDIHYAFLADRYPHHSFDAHLQEAMISLWRDPCILEGLKRSVVLPSMGIVPHFLDQLESLALDSLDHRLESDLGPPGIYKTDFSTNFGSLQTSLSFYHFLKMKSTIRELGCFVSECAAGLMILQLDGYHHIEHNQQPRIINYLESFRSIVKSRWMRYIPWILVFVKSATFDQDLSTHPLEVYFPDYSGQEAEDFISMQFKKLSLHGFPSRLSVRWMDLGNTAILESIFALLLELSQ